MKMVSDIATAPNYPCKSPEPRSGFWTVKRYLFIVKSDEFHPDCFVKCIPHHWVQLLRSISFISNFSRVLFQNKDIHCSACQHSRLIVHILDFDPQNDLSCLSKNNKWSMLSLVSTLKLRYFLQTCLLLCNFKLTTYNHGYLVRNIPFYNTIYTPMLKISFFVFF